MIKVLIFSRDSKWFGGVVNFIDLLRANLSPDVESTQFMVGRRKGIAGILLRPLRPLIDALRLILVLLSNDYGCFHLNPSLNGPPLFRDGIFLLILKLLRKKNIVVCFHGWDSSTESRIEDSCLRRWLFVKLFGSVDCILVLAQPFKDWMARMGVDPDKIQLFTTMFDGRELENTLGHVNKDGHNTSLLFLSRFVKEKGVYELLEAFINLVSNHKNIHLILAGTGPEEDNMKKIVCDSNIENKVTFTGYVRGSDKARVLMGADIFVFPTSYGEGCPVSLLESMAAGMAVITTPVGGIPHIVEDGKQGILLTNEVTAKSVENAIERLLVDPVETRKIGDLNREQAWRLYNAPVVTGWFESIYKNGCPQSE